MLICLYSLVIPTTGATSQPAVTSADFSFPNATAEAQEDSDDSGIPPVVGVVVGLVLLGVVLALLFGAYHLRKKSKPTEKSEYGQSLGNSTKTDDYLSVYENEDASSNYFSDRDSMISEDDVTQESTTYPKMVMFSEDDVTRD